MKDILGFEKLYRINQEGRIWSYEKKIECWNGYKMISYIRPSQEIKTFIGRCGYRTCVLRKNKKNYNILVHRAMGSTYLNLKKTQDINHKDGNKINNSLSNLEVCSRRENLLHAKRLGLTPPYKKGEDHHCNKSWLKDKEKIEKEIEKGTATAKICAMFELSPSRFYDIKNKKHWWYRDE